MLYNILLVSAVQCGEPATEAKGLVIQLRLTLCKPLDCSLPGSSVNGILQANILEGLPLPSPSDLPDPGVEPLSLMFPDWQTASLLLVPHGYE